MFSWLGFSSRFAGDLLSAGLSRAGDFSSGLLFVGYKGSFFSSIAGCATSFLLSSMGCFASSTWVTDVLGESATDGAEIFCSSSGAFKGAELSF